MARHQGVPTSPARQLPAVALWSLHHPCATLAGQVPHTHTATLAQAHHPGTVHVSLAQPGENTGCVDYTWGLHTVYSEPICCLISYVIFNSINSSCSPNVQTQPSSHLPDHASGAYSRAARTDLPLRGLVATKENRAFLFLSSSSLSRGNIWSFPLLSFSPSSSELRNWCCSKTNSTPCIGRSTQTYKLESKFEAWHNYCGAWNIWHTQPHMKPRGLTLHECPLRQAVCDKAPPRAILCKSCPVLKFL